MTIIGRHGKGKILRIKQGYNPNSSSVGSQIPYLFAFFAGTGMITIITLHLFHKFKKILKLENKNANQEAPDEK
ncbi:hypothetical protein D1AOALGA4SA_6587 [Olavius algarvensis Delta 1 endosymbiont]|nr:hypothetical protein D1AOALGA4SA_6587 [Olavius algarvensis Delta 1 endosymbiont]